MNRLIEEIIHNISLEFKGEIESIKYQFMDASEIHFIEICPSSIFDSEKFSDVSYGSIQKFINSKDGGMLSFITEGSLTVLDCPQYKSTGFNNLNMPIIVQEVPWTIDNFTGNIVEVLLKQGIPCEDSYAMAA